MKSTSKMLIYPSIVLTAITSACRHDSRNLERASIIAKNEASKIISKDPKTNAHYLSKQVLNNFNKNYTDVDTFASNQLNNAPNRNMRGIFATIKKDKSARAFLNADGEIVVVSTKNGAGRGRTTGKKGIRTAIVLNNDGSTNRKVEFLADGSKKITLGSSNAVIEYPNGKKTIIIGDYNFDNETGKCINRK